MERDDITRSIEHEFLPMIEKEKTDVPPPSEGMMLGASFGTQPLAPGEYVIELDTPGTIISGDYDNAP